MAKLRKAYLKYTRHKRELKRKAKEIEEKGRKAYAKLEKGTKTFAEKSGLKELADVRKHMPYVPKKLKGKVALIHLKGGTLYVKSPYNRNKKGR